MMTSGSWRKMALSASCQEKGGVDAALGRSRGGLTTKIHLTVDARGRPVCVILTGGQGHDITLAQGSQAVIPPRTCQKPRSYDKARYRLRNIIERRFSRLKQYRRIATRYDRKPANFLAFIYLASLACWVQ